MALIHHQFESIHPFYDGNGRTDRIINVLYALMDTKHRIRKHYKFYSQDLINNLFTHPYTKIEYVERDLDVSRLTATRYLDTLAADGILLKQKKGRSNYYVNVALNTILTRNP